MTIPLITDDWWEKLMLKNEDNILLFMIAGIVTFVLTFVFIWMGITYHIPLLYIISVTCMFWTCAFPLRLITKWIIYSM
jgi:hypothetical protein